MIPRIRIRASWTVAASVLALCAVAAVGPASASSATTDATADTATTTDADPVSAADLAAAANTPEDDTPMAADSAMDLSAAQAAALPKSWNTPIGVFHLSGTSASSRFCSGSVIYSPHGDLVVTAAHCMHSYVSDPGKVWFYPDYADNKPSAGRYGMWQAKKIIIPSGYHYSDKNSPFDYAFVVLKPYNGGTVAQRTGWLNPQINPSFNTAAHKHVTVAGYNYADRGGNLDWCRSTTAKTDPYRDGAIGKRYTSVMANCGKLGDGTSGGPFITTGTYNQVGLMGGRERGGVVGVTNYSPYFDHTFAAYWKKAEAY
ncbi:MAG: trypsin-like serine protease [Catenulispora sp.]|nr:trypsin-like serine protease [Catenulispora sp.]